MRLRYDPYESARESACLIWNYADDLPYHGRAERWLSGRKRRFAKPLYGLNRIGGSNPPLSASFYKGFTLHTKSTPSIGASVS